jgi:hypothetical protein
MKKVEPPKILADLYRDLRDRRLLVPFIALAVALILVPLALSKSSHRPTATPATAATGARAQVSAAEPAVMTETFGVRNFNKRLSALKQKDPFQRHFVLPKLPGGNPGKLAPPSTSATPASTPTTAPTGAPAGSTPPATSPVTASPTSATPVTTTPTSTTPTRTVTVHSNSPSPGLHLYHSVVDLKVGQPNKLKKREGVQPLTELPHESNPVVALMGASLDTTHAVFLVNRDVTSVQGGRSCAPSRSACQLLDMKPGGKAKLKDSADGKTYVLKVLDIRLVRDSSAHGKSGTTGPGKSHGGGLVPGRSVDYSAGLSR